MLWQDLAGADAARTHLAVWAWFFAPGQAVPLLRDRLRPTRFDAGRCARHLADLDSNDFATRERAAAALANMGRPAEESLKRALDDKPSPEARKRLEQLLKNLEEGVLSAEEVRAERGVEVLEQIGTPEARKVLQHLADGAPEAVPTEDAKQALERRAKRV